MPNKKESFAEYSNKFFFEPEGEEGDIMMEYGMIIVIVATLAVALWGIRDTVMGGLNKAKAAIEGAIAGSGGTAPS